MSLRGSVHDEGGRAGLLIGKLSSQVLTIVLRDRKEMEAKGIKKPEFTNLARNLLAVLFHTGTL